MRFEVPQFIEIEDKIFGPLTWRQFVYLGGGIGIAIVLFLYNKTLFLFVGIPVALLAAALAFYPVNNRPFSYFLEAFTSYLSGQKLYLWRKETSVYKNEVPSPATTTSSASRKERARNLSDLARKLEMKALEKK